MEDVNLIVESLKFMILGMGIVFIFLTVLIFALKLQAKLIAKFFTKEVKKDMPSTWKPQVKQEDDKDTIAAITAAIIHHNNNNK